ncbi:DUF348 domain-containing protein [Cohnella pontilimi]|uniref:DUF348 domain-containing protein n=1 Tax=Cohnella pontilimi TaxID=2564100 RepID=A0A4U0F267_9BACL|nr:3D domain-containing protein [Cohnella pontilimi]TJY38585.1 DUF348 domain-containing protein [Cohnella pontilimi]
MGIFPAGETHDPRPTGKLIAAKWKHEHLRVILIGAILSFAVITMYTSLLNGASAKSVTVVDDGKFAVYQTRSSDVSGFLEEQNINVGPYDRLSLSLADPLHKRGHIVIERAKQISIQADGTQQVKYTTEQTVGSALKAFGVQVGAQDRVVPALDSPLLEGIKVSVIRVRTENTETKEPIRFAVVERKDADLAVGKKKVITAGKPGVLVKKVVKVYENGKLVRQQVLNQAVAQPAVQQVVAVGTKKKPKVTTLAYNASTEGNVLKLNGNTVKVKHVLNNVTLTAYSAGVASTGKSKGHPEYGITRSGTRVQEGRTIAVDPKVIPLGWWVYIEGIGLRRAEDTGSAIKGKKIDVYYDSEAYADRFGLKRGYTVYVIGPVKPTAS